MDLPGSAVEVPSYSGKTLFLPIVEDRGDVVLALTIHLYGYNGNCVIWT